MRISYHTEEKEWTERINKCGSLEQLKDLCFDVLEYAPDAYMAVCQMTEDDFDFFVRGLVMERKGEYAGDKWADKFMAIIMPKNFIQASLAADNMKAPFGTALIRMFQVKNGKRFTDSI